MIVCWLNKNNNNQRHSLLSSSSRRAFILCSYLTLSSSFNLQQFQFGRRTLRPNSFRFTPQELNILPIHRWQSTISASTLSPSALMGGAFVTLRTQKVAPTENNFSAESFHEATVLSHTKDAEGLRMVTVKVPQIIADHYIYPGQYVKVRSKESPEGVYYFAILSPPTNPRSMDINTQSSNPPSKKQRLSSVSSFHQFEFLVKDIPAHQFLFTSSEIEMSLPMGDGYNVSSLFPPTSKPAATPLLCSPCSSRSSFVLPSSTKEEERDGGTHTASNHPPGRVEKLLLFATGSGIAPIASLIDSSYFQSFTNPTRPQDGSNRRNIQLFYGIKSEDHLPLKEKIAEWTRMGIEVIPVFSQPTTPNEPDVDGPRGKLRVQHVFQHSHTLTPTDPAVSNSSGTVAFLSGQR